MNLDPDKLFQKHRGTGLLLDTNLLLLYVIGSYDPNQVGRGRLSKFTTEDLDLLINLRSRFRSLITTPHILAETSNLVGADLTGKAKASCFEALATQIELLSEIYVSSTQAAQRAEFRFLGLTDCTIAEVSALCFVLSDDLRMTTKLQEAGLEAVNFTYFRTHLQQLV